MVVLYSQIYEYAGTTMNLQIVSNNPKNPYLKQPTPKIVAKFSYLKKNPNWKFQTQKLLRSPLSLEIWSSPSPSPRLFLTISSRIVDRQDDSNGKTEDNDCINQKMLLKNYILQCVYTTLQSNVLIRDSYENKDPRKQALGFKRKQKKNKRQINKYKFVALWRNTKKATQHKIAIFSRGDSKFWKQWQIQR